MNSPTPVSSDPMCSPVTRSFSEDEMQRIARKWMVQTFGEPAFAENRDQWYERLGLLTHFAVDLWNWSEPT